MDRSIVVILPGTLDTSRNIVRYLRDLDIEIKMIPILRVKINRDEIKAAQKIFSSGFTPDVSIFTSKTAVKIVKKLIPVAWRCAKKYSIAIGPGTASLIRKLGGLEVKHPQEHSSEGLMKYLINFPESIRLAAYCSSEVNMSLENFLKEYFKDVCLWKLYTLSEETASVKEIVDLVGTSAGRTYLIVITSLKILKIISREVDLLTKYGNVFFSAISKRLAREASRLGLKINHLSSTNNIIEYYNELRQYIENLLRHS
ncbi:MAG: uroporphyrinogen-III synthase [Nitrososphaerota archaeon]|nr:uroporphyrinogen-III synthase [Candidatus Geocrenenecus dongiae]